MGFTFENKDGVSSPCTTEMGFHSMHNGGLAVLRQHRIVAQHRITRRFLSASHSNPSAETEYFYVKETSFNVRNSEVSKLNTRLISTAHKSQYLVNITYESKMAVFLRQRQTASLRHF